jgi:LysM repeat protein
MKYKIKSGDTLSQIAKDNNISVKKLAELNNIKDVNKIYAGRTLNIPSKKKESKKSTFIERRIFEDEAPLAARQEEDFYTGNIPLAARQLASDTKYDFLRNFLPKDTADKVTKKLFGEEKDITKKDLSEEEFNVLRNLAARNIAQNKFSIDYNDWRDAGAGGTSTIKDNPFELIGNPARSMQYSFGQGSLFVDDKGDVYFRDQFNFNDAKLGSSTVPYPKKDDWDKEGYLKMEYDRGLAGILSNQFKRIRNYKTRVGRGEGEGARTNMFIGNIKDFQQPSSGLEGLASNIITSRKSGV